MAKKPSNKAKKKSVSRRHPVQAKATKPAVVAATGRESSSAVLGKPEIKKIQGLLTSKTADSVALGLSLIESLKANRDDYEAIFTETVMKSILSNWVATIWGAAARLLVPHVALSALFQRIAAEQFRKRHKAYQRTFAGLVLARAPTVKAEFLQMLGGLDNATKPFIDLVNIPSGTFTMGSRKGKRAGKLYDSRVEVRITQTFEMGRTVVTQGQWRALVGTEPWRSQRNTPCGEDFPAVYVSREDAVLFCQILTDTEREEGRLTASQAYRLPTEAEWEYACRAGTTTTYSFGASQNKLSEYGWFKKNSDHKLQKVACKKPNPWGLFDMHGNVWEWCEDLYVDTLVGGDDPLVPVRSTDSGRCVARGGGWDSVASLCGSAYRLDYLSDRVNSFGFRVVRNK